MLIDLNQQLGDETVKQIEALAHAPHIKADVRDEGQMKRAFVSASRAGRLDIVYNTAGIATLQPDTPGSGRGGTGAGYRPARVVPDATWRR